MSLFAKFVAATLIVMPIAVFADKDKDCKDQKKIKQQLPATGQTGCWDVNGTAIPCAYTGQDGELQAGAVLSYTDNGDGTLTDNNTGLVWEKKGNDGSIHDFLTRYSWDQAFSVHVATLNAIRFAGHGDWRLPNVRELQTIVNFASSSPAVSEAFNTPHCVDGSGVSITELTGNCTPRQGFYFSSTSRVNGTDSAWSVEVESGYSVPIGKSLPWFVRAVRCGFVHDD